MTAQRFSYKDLAHVKGIGSRHQHDLYLFMPTGSVFQESFSVGMYGKTIRDLVNELLGDRSMMFSVSRITTPPSRMWLVEEWLTATSTPYVKHRLTGETVLQLTEPAP